MVIFKFRVQYHNSNKKTPNTEKNEKYLLSSAELLGGCNNKGWQGFPIRVPWWGDIQGSRNCTTIFKVRISCSPSGIYLFTFFTWRLLIFSLCDMSWAKLYHILHTFWTTWILWTLKYNIKIFWFEILTFWDFKGDFKFLVKILNVLTEVLN